MRGERRLRRWLRERAAGTCRAVHPPATRPTATRATTPAVAPGLVVDERVAVESSVLAELPADRRERLLFFDLETTGLAAGDRIFMAGYLRVEGSHLRLIQDVALDDAEERLLLDRASQRLARRPWLVTYNGRSFDVHALRRRLARHGLPGPPADLEVVDLLHPARRRFRHQLANCRLGTIEREVLGVVREGRDIPGVEVPLRYRDYVATGDARHLDPILYHNRVDLLTLARLYPVVLADDDEDSPTATPENATPAADGADAGEHAMYS